MFALGRQEGRMMAPVADKVVCYLWPELEGGDEGGAVAAYCALFHPPAGERRRQGGHGGARGACCHRGVQGQRPALKSAPLVEWGGDWWPAALGLL
eukprot:1190536-Prorocentrum_minimum.AAC.6